MQRFSRALKTAVVAGVAGALASTMAMAESLNIRLDKAEILRLDIPASIVIVGNPEIADVTVENPNMLFLTGLAAGETNLIVLDDVGQPIMEYDLVVVAERDRHVTVHRNVEVLTTYSCKPRCIEVANPSQIERLRQFSQPEDEDDADADAADAENGDDAPDEAADASADGPDDAG